MPVKANFATEVVVPKMMSDIVAVLWRTVEMLLDARPYSVAELFVSNSLRVLYLSGDSCIPGPDPIIERCVL